MNLWMWVSSCKLVVTLYSFLFADIPCPEEETDYSGYDIWYGSIDQSVKCAELCVNKYSANCSVWVYDSWNGVCYIKGPAALANKNRLADYISGVKGCIPEKSILGDYLYISVNIRSDNDWTLQILQNDLYQTNTKFHPTLNNDISVIRYGMKTFETAF